MYYWLPSDFDFADIEEDIPPTQRAHEEKSVPKDTEHMCIRCKDWFKDVSPNQDDGSFKCWLCREFPFR